MLSCVHVRITHRASPAALTEPGPRSGTVQVLGGPGTGKSTLLVEAATAHIAGGADPESVLLLTGSARLRTQARATITSPLLQPGAVPWCVNHWSAPCTPTRSGCCGWRRSRNGDPPPRLITGAEQDVIIRELLAGDLEDGDEARWPGRRSCGRR